MRGTWSSQFLLKSITHTLNISSKVRILRLSCLFFWGWKSVFKFTFESKPFWKDLQNCVVHYAPLYEIMKSGTPSSLTNSWIYYLTQSSAEWVVFIGRKWTDLVILSKITQIESYYLRDLSKNVMKSILSIFHFRFESLYSEPNHRSFGALLELVGNSGT